MNYKWCDGVSWIHLPLHRKKWQAVVNIVMNPPWETSWLSDYQEYSAKKLYKLANNLQCIQFIQPSTHPIHHLWLVLKPKMDGALPPHTHKSLLHVLSHGHLLLSYFYLTIKHSLHNKITAYIHSSYFHKCSNQFHR